MLSRIAAQQARTPLAAFASLAAPLAAASTSAGATAGSSQPRSFSTSAPAGESRARRKTRLVRKANLEKKAQLVRQHEQSRPDPVLGFAKGNDALWDKSLLKSVLLNRDEVWAQPAQADATGAGADAAARGTAGAEGYTPELYNFGLDAQTAEQLSSVLPATAALRSTLGDQATSVDAIMLERFETATTREEAKRDALMRIVDLRNADSKGIEVENTRRIVATFGRTPGDTASPEVQSAILTMRIRSLAAHLISSPRDVQNRQALRQLISRRAKILKYLRAVSVSRYEECLDQIGVEPRAVEGEVIVSKAELRTMIRGA
ncbi:mitochondrial 37S ribosomal protein uS15m MRPS28 [Rhodotorula paludigena]|uniref:mitochondrial 37S ribosomal protein uS15m MRPS28 n=1 Tax=Rhodotorula paludigena TaxID=86838 RepID=UPI00317709C3